MPKRSDRRRLGLIVRFSLSGLIGLSLIGLRPAQSAALTRTYTAQIGYPPTPAAADYVTNARLAMTQLQAFLAGLTFKQAVNYSLLHGALRNAVTLRAGYADTDQGVGVGVCAAATLLDRVVLNAVYRDTDHIDKPVFQSLGALPARDSVDGLCTLDVTFDPADKRTQDYVWRLNPNYNAPPPRLALTLNDAGAALTLTYADREPSPPFEPSPDGYAAQLAAQFGAIVPPRKVGIAVLPIGEPPGVAATGYQADEQLPVASAFKGPVALYFFENVSDQVWRSLPVRYWNVDKSEAVPEPYRAAWQQYGAVLKNVYQMAVFSENDATGKTLAYVYQHALTPISASNPVRAFNDWSQARVGVSVASGLHAWLAGATACVGCTDDRYSSRPLVYGGQILYINNTYSARDLARFYAYLARAGRALGYYDTAIDVLSHQHFSLIRDNAAPFGIAAASKDGYIAPNSEYGTGYRISTDAGLLTLPDGEQYAVALLAFDAGDRLPSSIQALSRALIGHERAGF